MTSDQRPAARLHNRVLFAMIRSAVMTPQSAIIIAVAILLYGFGVSLVGLNPLFWLVFGVIGVAAYVFATLTDPRASAKVIEQMLADRYNPARLKNPAARERLEKALEYYGAIQALMLARSGASKVEFQNTIDDVDDMIEHLYALGSKLDSFEANQIVNRDRLRVRTELENLNRRIKAENNPKVVEELQESTRIKQMQLQNLESLEVNAKRAEIQMENTLSQLGTIYAQLQVIGSKDIDHGSAQRLRNQMHDQVLELQDTIAAIDEVQGQTRLAS